MSGSCDGVPQAANDKAKTASSTANKRPPLFIANEPTSPLNSVTYPNKSRKQDAWWLPISIKAARNPTCHMWHRPGRYSAFDAGASAFAKAPADKEEGGSKSAMISRSIMRPTERASRSRSELAKA